MAVYSISRLLGRGVFALLGPVRVLHRERTGLPGAFLLASNHISHFDPPLISVAALRKIDWMAMAELFRHRWAAAFFRSIDAIRTDRSQVDRAAVRMALRRLREGRVVGIFPEGGIRAGPGSLLEGAPPRPGAVTLAQLADVPVVPCLVLGTDRLYNPWRWLPFRRTTFWVAFGPALEQHRDVPRLEARARLEHDLAECFQALYREMQETFRLGPDDLPKSPQARMQGK